MMLQVRDGGYDGQSGLVLVAVAAGDGTVVWAVGLYLVA